MKRKVLGFLLFLLVVPLLMACDQRATMGTVTIEIVTNGDNPATTEVEESYVSNSVEVDYFEDDMLFDLLMEHFDVICQGEDGQPDDTCAYESEWGHYILGIDTLNPTESNEYVSFTINGEYAMSGVDVTAPEDGAVYTFSIETF